METLERAAPHDLGGRTKYMCVPVDRTQHPGQPDAFGQRCDALRLVLGAKGIMSTDELRRAVESLPPEDYAALPYYERWLRAIVVVLREKGLIAQGDLP
ncbi:SH3-like domain-containing protein [Enterovirga aerilata]|uniref:Nitrile hydratase subunit beta n=1 Tax=Enterovirga aerilata TaxID=2730920 RepID=A0A849IJQ9_9HYPH|nr:SH3-like domain-containing protein [Enterovirga sp. DB1703]NNM74173.1 nitrile hydratase subunit beta [Enterovirga sp. DB1703]